MKILKVKIHNVLTPNGKLAGLQRSREIQLTMKERKKQSTETVQKLQSNNMNNKDTKTYVWEGRGNNMLIKDFKRCVCVRENVKCQIILLDMKNKICWYWKYTFINNRLGIVEKFLLKFKQKTLLKMKHTEKKLIKNEQNNINLWSNFTWSYYI